MEHKFQWIAQAEPDSVQLAAAIMPALRGKSGAAAFPSVCFKKWADLTEPEQIRVKQAEACVNLQNGTPEALFDAIDQLSPETEIVVIEGLGVFACCATARQAHDRLEMLLRGEDGLTDQVPLSGRLQGRVIVVTGGAQGLGRNVSECLLREGAYVVLADVNYPLAQKEAEEFCRTFGEHRAVAYDADVTSAESVEALCRETVLRYGGIDVMFSNAGIVIPGDLESICAEDMQKVFAVNCVGYFHCAKYASRYMKIQSAFSDRYTADIINTSSVAGLIGYPKNSPYCATKFGVLGMTESFAKELLPYRIKVNSVCPGNYLDGPLWSDPEKGLFVQYLNAGKVPNGKTVQDSIDYYRNREPFKRGMYAEDLARGVIYCIEQQFETGIAVPVTGGLYMGAM